MEHRELYRGIVPKDAYIITFTDLAGCKTPAAAAKIAKSIYYPVGGSYSNEKMDDGKRVHAIKEAEVGDWDNELRLAYKMADKYYLTGTLDRYHKSSKIIEDYKRTEKEATYYLPSSQIETYAFLAMNNDLVVESGVYTTVDSSGATLTQAPVEISAYKVAICYSTFILPRFNLIKRELERLENQYVKRTNSPDPSEDN